MKNLRRLGLICCLLAVALPVFAALPPYFPPPNVTPEDGNGCWQYGSDSNYHYGTVCSTSPYTCVRQCLENQDVCVQGCFATCGNDDNTPEGCFEHCGDNCRTKYNTCESRCS